MTRIIAILTLSIFFCACAKKETTQAPPKPVKPTHYGRNLDNMVRIITYDIYGQKIADGIGTYIAHDIVVTPMSWFKGALKANVNQMDNRTTYSVFGYVAYDIDNDLVALRIGKRNTKITPLDTTTTTPTDTLYTLDSRNKKTLKTTVSIVDGKIKQSLTIGTAIYDNNGNLKAIAGQDNKAINAKAIEQIRAKCGDSHNNIYDLRLKTNKVYPSHKTIKAFRIETTMGNITIRLLNDTPEYRDNFIRLVTDNFYDSLLIHRVLPNYLIQTGAADSKHAQADDIVGWQGPGYTLNMHTLPHLFHKRGVVAASKLPQDHNKSNRSDGSQFFIVAGRKFTNNDLDLIEKEYDKKFSAAQRKAYTTVGGAPYLDGDYTVFAEVTAGMEIVDKIAATQLNGDRPAEDIRIKDIVAIKY